MELCYFTKIVSALSSRGVVSLSREPRQYYGAWRDISGLQAGVSWETVVSQSTSTQGPPHCL